MKKLNNTEGELKKSIACKKKRVVLNCSRFLHFRPFTHDIFTKSITDSKIYIFIGVILQVRQLGRGRE